MSEYHKQYYQTHKADWFVKNKCDICGGSYCKASRYNHFKTKKHQIALNNASKQKLETQITLLNQKIILIEQKLSKISD